MRLYQDQPAGTVDRARVLRKAASPVERRLLHGLRAAFPRLKWRHQAPIGPFFADILCLSERLVIEVDGDSHAGAEADDARRTTMIEREGFCVIRFTNAEVVSNLAGVLDAVASRLTSPSPRGANAPAPSPNGRGEEPRSGEGVRATQLAAPKPKEKGGTA